MSGQRHLHRVVDQNCVASGCYVKDFSGGWENVLGWSSRGIEVDSGLTVECPARGPACIVTGTATEGDTSFGSFVPIGKVRITIAASQQRQIAFSLSRVGASC